MSKVHRSKMSRRLHVILQSAAMILLILAAVFFLQKTDRDIQNTDISVNAGGQLKVHFIDVGQADCILIQAGEKNMLIDAGNNEDAEIVVAYLKEHGVKKLDYVIGTHGHEDHIGSLDEVIYQFEIGELFLPRQSYDSKSYRDVLKAVKVIGIGITVPSFQDVRSLGEARFIFVTPDAKEDYEDVNDSSLGIRITNGAHSFLMCGDISKEMEKRLIRSRIYLQSDVLKLNHHGSSDTSSEAFLKAVAPRYAVISCEANNEFGHPHESTMKKLRELGMELFRTDQQGTIIFSSNGKQLTCNVPPIVFTWVNMENTKR